MTHLSAPVVRFISQSTIFLSNIENITRREENFKYLTLDIHRNFSTYYSNLWKKELQHTANNTFGKIEHNILAKPKLFNRKDEIIINRLRIGDFENTYSHITRREN